MANELIKKVAVSAVAGFVSAFMVDLDKWKQADANATFDWSLALKRWLIGALGGVFTALGLQGV